MLVAFSILAAVSAISAIAIVATMIWGTIRYNRETGRNKTQKNSPAAGSRRGARNNFVGSL